MSLYAIGDLHLSLSGQKPMDIFGGWENYVQRLAEGFSALGPDDVCVLCGDTSWAMNLEDARADFAFIEALPGRKIILKGNHDYWWSTAAKISVFFEKNGIKTVSILHNNAYPYGEDAAVCGTRGWFYEEAKGGAHDKKLIDRECLRLEASLKAAGAREKYVFLHYPPKYGNYSCPELLALLKAYGARTCCSGHLHADSIRLAYNGALDGTEHRCVSADALAFKPCKIL